MSIVSLFHVFVVSMDTSFHRFLGVKGFTVSWVSWGQWFHGFIRFVVSIVSLFHRSRGVNGFMVS